MTSNKTIAIRVNLTSSQNDYLERMMSLSGHVCKARYIRAIILQESPLLERKVDLILQKLSAKSGVAKP